MTDVSPKSVVIFGLAGAGFILAPGLPLSLGTHGNLSYIGPILVIMSGPIFMIAGLGLGITIRNQQLNWIHLAGTGYLMIGIGLTTTPILNFAIYNQIISPDQLLLLICGVGALWLGIELVRGYRYNDAS